MRKTGAPLQCICIQNIPFFERVKPEGISYVYFYRKLVQCTLHLTMILIPLLVVVLLGKYLRFCFNVSQGGFPVIAEITRILAANIRRQIFFVITTTASTRCLVQSFQLICYSQRVNATSQYSDTGGSRCSKWPNDRMVAVVKHCWLLE